MKKPGNWDILATGLVVLALLVAIAMLAGCGFREPPQDDGADTISPGVGAALAAIGHWILVGGSGALCIGALGFGLSLVPLMGLSAILKPFRDLLEVIILVGLGLVVLGSGFVWVGHHAWLIAVAIGLFLGLLGVRHRHYLLRLLRIETKPVART